jgi:phage antirepressor protein|nr:MAG TPA: KilAC domain protein [Caudoviricetes sp.]
MNIANQVFRYNGNPITFQRGDSVMVNATEMAKPFGKFPKDWIKTKQAEELIASVSSNRNILPFELVHVVQGSPETGGGTWLHEDLALIFAQWLNPQFYLWCNDRVKELLTTGVAVNPLANASRSELLRLALQAEEEKEALQAKVQEDAPKVAFATAVLASNTSILIGELAKTLRQNGVDIGQNRLFEWMRCEGYLCSKHGEMRNQPTQKAMDKGLFELKKGVRSGNDGVLHTTITTKVTPKGQVYFVNKFLNNQQPCIS